MKKKAIVLVIAAVLFLSTFGLSIYNTIKYERLNEAVISYIELDRETWESQFEINERLLEIN